jgi:hypothetical protein
MKQKLSEVEFNLNHNMAKHLIIFNELKKELINIKSKSILEKEDLIKINKLENKLNKIRIKFIKEFRENNRKEINEYLELKDQ